MSNLIVKMHRKRSKHKHVADITDQDTSDSDEDIFKDVIDHEFQEELKGLPEVLKYINHLLTLINRQQVKLDKVCLKVKKLKKRIKKIKQPTHITDTSTQTEDLTPAPPAEAPITAPCVASVTIKREPKCEPEPEPEVDPEPEPEPEPEHEPTASEPSNAWVVGDGQESGQSLAEQVKQAAQSAMQRTSFVYEPTSGMYYDYNTNYYYNAEMGLYYDGNTGQYLYYDAPTQTYLFHSQAAVAETSSKTIEAVVSPQEDQNVVCEPKPRERRKKPAKQRKTSKVVIEQVESPEEGECSDSSSSAASVLEDTESKNTSEAIESNVDELRTQVWPPCMRVIVKETGLEGLKVGTLFIVTCTGGTMGREGDHAVLIPDINISKHHAKFSFDETDGTYRIVDFGSRNGTYLNSKRLSVAKQESEPWEIVHGSTITVGSTSLMCHIHPGTETCGHCEPGLVQKPDVPESKPVFTFGEKNRKSQMKRIRKKFGLEINEVNDMPDGYEDRAQIRRIKVGSSHDHNEKTKVASVHESIPEDNKGFKMLAKMGWSKGQALGKDGDGLIEPVLQEQRDGKAGLGAKSPPSRSRPGPKDERKTAVWKKTQERYKEISKLPCADMFEDDDSPDELKVRDVTTVKRKEIATPPSSPPEAISIDERKNLLWKKTQQRFKKTKKTVQTFTPPSSPPQGEGDGVH